MKTMFLERKAIRVPAVRFVVAALLSLTSASVGYGEAVEPRLVISKPVFDFGTVAQGEVVEHQFRIANSGKGTLQIRKIHPSCGCTAVVLDTDSLEPGESTHIKASFNTAGFQGHKVKTVRIYTNDPENTSSVLTIKGIVRADVDIRPPRLHFGNVERGKPHVREATVFVDDSSGIKLLQVRSRAPELEITTEQLREPGRSGKKIIVTLTDKIPVGVFKTRVVVKTTSKKNPVVNIPVFAYVEGDLQLSPNSVAFGLIDSQKREQAVQEVTLRHRLGQPIEITDIKSDHPKVYAEFAPLSDKKGYTLKVVLRKEATGVIRARVSITTTHPDPEQREITLPVYAIVSRREPS